MRGKVIYRIAAGTCSVCITYGLIMQAIQGESFSPSAVEVCSIDPPEVTVQAPVSVSPQSEFSTERWQIPDDPWNSGNTASGGKRGKQRGGKGRYAYTSDEQTFSSAEEEKQRAGLAGAPNDQDSGTSIQSNASGDPPTLQQYLSLLRCSGCRHNCCLLSPRCMKGRTKQKNATVQYQTTYGG